MKKLRDLFPWPNKGPSYRKQEHRWKMPSTDDSQYTHSQKWKITGEDKTRKKLKFLHHTKKVRWF